MEARDMRTWPGRYHRDYYGGALIMLLGLGVAEQGSTYAFGSLTSMGPGFFPVSLGIILCALGMAIACGARRAQATRRADAVPRQPLEWRGWACILLGIVAFVVLGKYGGLLPASFAIVFISALGDRDNTWLSALILALAICAVGVVVFWWALQVQLPLFAWGQ